MKTDGKAGRVLCAVLLMTNAACYSTWDLSPHALAPLSDFHENDKVKLTDATGDSFTFDKTTQLSFEGPNTPFAKFASIRASGDTFTGILQDSTRPLVVNLQQVKTVHAKRWSLWKTTLLASAITLAVCLTALIIYVVAANNQSQSCDPNTGC